MGLIWWILPAIAGVIGLMLLFAAFGKFGNLKPFSGMTRLVFSVGFLGLAAAVALAGLNIQTFHRLTYERPVATVKFAAVDGETDKYLVTGSFAGGEPLVQGNGEPIILSGDQFAMGAQVIKFKPLANVVGYDSIYRLDYIEGRMARRFSAEAVSEATTNGLDLANRVGLDMHGHAQKFGKQFGIDAEYGSATYQPMGDGFEFTIKITQDALIARPSAETEAMIDRGSYPGFRSSKPEPAQQTGTGQ
jgi:hypothetical protein